MTRNIPLSTLRCSNACNESPNHVLLGVFFCTYFLTWTWSFQNDVQELYNYLGHTYNVLHNVVIHSLSCVVCALVLLAVYGLCCVVWVVMCGLCCVGCAAWVVLCGLCCVGCAVLVVLRELYSIGCVVWSLLCGLLVVCEGCVWVFVCGLLVVWVVVCGLCDINVCCVWCKIDSVMLVEVSLYLESTVYTIHSLNVVSLCIMLYILKTIKQEKVIVIFTTSLLCTTHTHTHLLTILSLH